MEEIASIIILSKLHSNLLLQHESGATSNGGVGIDEANALTTIRPKKGKNAGSVAVTGAAVPQEEWYVLITAGEKGVLKVFKFCFKVIIK